MKTPQKNLTAGIMMLTAFSLSRPSALRAAEFHTIKDVISATVDSDYYSAFGLIEGPDVGFESLPPYNRIGDTTWVTNAPYGFPSNYFEPLPDPAPKLVFDLGANVPLAEISVWGYGVVGNSIKDFSLRFATDAEGPDGAGGSITFNPTYSAAPPISPRQSFLFGQKLTARYVEMTPLNNNIALGPGGDRVGFGEVAFEIMPTVTGSFVELQSALAIGSASTVRQFTIQVRNIGPQPLTLTNPVFTGAGAGAFSVLNLPASVPAYTASVISLQFNPVGLATPAEMRMEHPTSISASPQRRKERPDLAPPSPTNRNLPPPSGPRTGRSSIFPRW